MATTQIRRVHWIEFNANAGTLQFHHVFPKYGTPLLAAILKERGYDVHIFLEGVSDMTFEKLTACDVVCFPVFAPILNKVRACARRIREERPALPLLMGGPHVCFAPEDVVDVCDAAVRCEGDEVLPELLGALGQGHDWRSIPGISYRQHGQIVHTPDRTPPAIPDTAPDLALIEGFHEIPRRTRVQRIVNTLQTSRGCHFRCRFCPTARLFGGSYRTRDVDSIIRDIRSRRQYNPIFFVVDNSFIGDRAHATELLHRLAREHLDVFFIVFERHEIGRDEELLKLMWRAGVRCVIVGIESLDDANLKHYDKRQSTDTVIESVENIQRSGLHVIGTFVLGGGNDTPQMADAIVRFVRKTGISLNLFIMHDVEEDESKELLIPLQRRFKTHYLRTDPHNTDFYDYLTGSFVTYFPLRMKPSTLQECILSVHERVYSHGGNLRRVLSHNIFASIFGVAHGYSIRSMNRSIRAIVDSGYMDHLRRVEDGLYDANENLIEERLAELKGLPVPRPIAKPVAFPHYERLVRLLVLPGVARYGLARLRTALAPSRNKS